MSPTTLGSKYDSERQEKFNSAAKRWGYQVGVFHVGPMTKISREISGGIVLIDELTGQVHHGRALCGVGCKDTALVL